MKGSPAPAHVRPPAQVSVLLATYRPNAAWLKEAIDSVLAQSFPDFELLVLDDEHSQETLVIVHSYVDDRIAYLRGPGRGPGANHAFGIGKAAAPLLAIINHDDVWERDLLDQLVHAFRSVPDAVLAFSDHAVINESGEVDKARSDMVSRRWGREALRSGVHQPFARIALVEGSVPIALAAVFPRDAVGTLDPRSGQSYDQYLAYILARTGRPAVYVPERLASWRDSSSNLTSNRSLTGSRGNLLLSWHLFRDPSLAAFRPIMGRRLVRSLKAVGLAAIRALPGGRASGPWTSST